MYIPGDCFSLIVATFTKWNINFYGECFLQDKEGFKFQICVKVEGKRSSLPFSYSFEAVFHSNVCITCECKNRGEDLHACLGVEVVSPFSYSVMPLVIIFCFSEWKRTA